MIQPAQPPCGIIFCAPKRSAPEQISFISARQSESRGGLFSSFRSIDDVEGTWRRHLNEPQLEAIEQVLHAIDERPPLASSKKTGSA